MNGQYNNDLFGGIVYLVIFAGFGCFLLTLTDKHYQTRKEQIALFLCAIFVRFAASIVIYELGLVNLIGDEDSSGWSAGILISDAWDRQQLGVFDLPELWADAYGGVEHSGFRYLSGMFFFLTGAGARLPLAAMNCFFGALTVVLVYRAAILLFSRWTASRAGWVACFFPSLIIWSAQTLKEPIIIFLEALALYACVNLKLSGFSLKYVLLCATAIILMPPFRFYAAYLAAATAVAALVIPKVGARIDKSRSSFKSALAAVGVGALVVSFAVSTGYLARNEVYLERYMQMNYIEGFKNNVAIRSGSGVRNEYDLRSPVGMAMAILIGGAHLLLAPFPWQLGGASLRMLLTTPELLIWWWLVFMGLVPGLWHVCRTRLADMQPMLFFIVGMGIVYSMMFGNIGLVYRQRAQLLPWLLIIAVVGLERRAIRRLHRCGVQIHDGRLLQPKQS